MLFNGKMKTYVYIIASIGWADFEVFTVHWFIKDARKSLLKIAKSKTNIFKERELHILKRKVR